MNTEIGLNWSDYGARFYDAVLGRFSSVDPLADFYPNIAPNVYVNNNPILNVDPDGQIFETAWDAANVIMGVASFVSNVKEGNVLAAVVDGVGVVADAAATLTPFVPGGVGASIKAARGVDKAVDVLKGTDKVKDAAKTLEVNKSIGKQGEKIATESLSKEVGEGKAVLEQISGKLDGGGRTQFDNVIVDKKTGKVEMVNETKTGNANYTERQSQYYSKGETATFTGKKARDAGIEGQKVNTKTTESRTTRIPREDIQ